MLYAFNIDNVKHSSEKSGVYLLYNSKRELIYIGKALNLRNRLVSYIQGKSSQGIFFPENVEYFDFIITNNEKEAFLLERDLIKSKKPKYNIKLRDDKNFFYLRIKIDEDFPFMDLKRQKSGKGNIYFGPFIPASYAFKILKILGKVFKIRTCKEKAGKRKRPCLDYFIGLCSAPCVNYISKEDYGKNVDNAVKVLKGETNIIIERLRELMRQASENLEFEKAADLRDTIFAIESINDAKYKTLKLNSEMDVWGIEKYLNSVLLFLLRFNSKGEINEKKEYFYSEIKISFPDFLLSFFSEFYSRYNPPKLLIINKLDNQNFFHTLSRFLSLYKGEKVKVIRGKSKKYKDIIENIKNNSKIKLKEYISYKALDEIKEIIGMDIIPEKIEGIDISHLSGEDIVASKVTFFNGEPEKQLYRRYYIKGKEKPNDPENIYKIVKRRLARTDNDRIPDLLLIDGGKAQLNYAKKAVEELSVKINLISISKGEKDTLHFINGEKYEEDGSDGFFLLKRIRDESHRFALKYQKKRRDMRKFHLNK